MRSNVFIEVGAVVAFLMAAGIAVYAQGTSENRRKLMRVVRHGIIGRKPGGVVELKSIPSGARLFVDGEDSGRRTPVTIENLESEVVHDIRLELAGEPPQTATVSVRAGERQTTTITIDSAIVALTVKSTPSQSELAVGGRTIAFTPATLPVRVGEKTRVSVTRVGYEAFERDIEPQRGQPIVLFAELAKNEEMREAEAEERAVRDELERQRRPKRTGRVKRRRAR